MGADEHGQHARGLVVLDEAHATHIGSQIVDLVHAVGGLHARLKIHAVADNILGVAMNLIPAVKWLHIN